MGMFAPVLQFSVSSIAQGFGIYRHLQIPILGITWGYKVYCFVIYLIMTVNKSLQQSLKLPSCEQYTFCTLEDTKILHQKQYLFKQYVFLAQCCLVLDALTESAMASI